MADKQDIARVSDVAKWDDVHVPTLKPQDFLGQEFALMEWESKRGDMGQYFILHCVDPTTGEEMSFSTGSRIVRAQIAELRDKFKPPMLFRWGIQNKSVYMD